MTGFMKKKTAAPLALYDGVAEGLKVRMSLIMSRNWKIDTFKLFYCQGDLQEEAAASGEGIKVP